MASELDQLLFGSDQTERITAVDFDVAESAAKVFVRDEHGEVEESAERFQPFIYLDGERILKDAEVDCEVQRLIGDAGFTLLARFGNCGEYDEAVKLLARHYRSHRSDYDQQPYYEVKEFAHQYLLASGKTHFRGMEWGEVRVVHLALRLNAPEELADPADKSQRIEELGVKCGDDVTVLTASELSEKEMLERFVALVQETDPDVVCGHNLFKTILDFIAARARKHKVKLKLGRGGREAWSERYTMPLAERRLEFPRLRVFGRSLVDTWILAQGYDIFKREMDSYDLPYLAHYLGLRTKVREDEDVRAALEETDGVVRTLIQNFFHLSQMLPYTLEDCIIKGNATKINALLLREYYRQAVAVPYPAEGRMFAGGYTDLRATGVLKPVINVDVASLYPSLILHHKYFPQGDRLGAYEASLRELLKRRLEIKHELRLLKDPRRFAQLDARQGTFKIVINSFYGYLGTSRMNFADLDMAERVTAKGQQTVQQMADIVEGLGASIAEIDTDGIYLVPPEGYVKSGDYEGFVEKVNAQMPEGVDVELGGVYEAMLSYKVKNYALLDADGRVTIKGSGMKSRGLEPFLRRFIEDSIRLILQDRAAEVEGLYEGLKRTLADGEIPVRELAKTEILVDSLSTYQRKLETTRRNRQAQYEMALKNPNRYKPGDPVSYYISGESPKVKAYEAAKLLSEYDPQQPDANIPYYQKRLEETYKRVQGFTVGRE
jgi:DNA polymerase I